MYKTTKYLMGALFLCSQPGLASLTAGEVSTATGNNAIAHTQATSLMLRWSVVRDAQHGQPGLTVSSLQGEFYDPATGRVLRVVNRRLSKTQQLGSIPASIVLTENLTIPLDLVHSAYRDGVRRIGYRRDFTDCPGEECGALPTPASITFSLGGSSAGPLNVTRLSLRFDDDSVFRSLQRGAHARAQVSLTVTQPGLVRGAWEIASPTTDGAAPRFQTLRLVNHHVASSGPVRVESPPLATDGYGVFYVRFRPIDPEMDATLPVIRYVVLQAGQEDETAPMRVLTPEAGSPLSASTVFQWSPVADAVAYQLIIAAAADDTAIAGVVVDGASAQTRLPSNVLSRLASAQRYRWRVQAIGNSGAIIGASQWQHL